MRHAPRALLAGGLGFAVSFLVACGGGAGLLSSDQASRLSSRLDAVSSAVSAHQCSAAARAATGLNHAVANLPSSVNASLRGNLLQGASTVSQVSLTECRTTSSTTTSSTTSSPSSSTSTSSSSSSPTSSSTSSSSSSPTSSSTSATTTNSSSTGSSSSGNGGAGLGGAGKGGGNT